MSLQELIRIRLQNLLKLANQKMSSGIDGGYDPFLYPPNYQLAALHQAASMPGKPDKVNPNTCSCCNEKVKIPFRSWWGRSIEKDFSRFGGAVVCYFWLLKLYFISSLVIILIYGAYLHYLSDYYCSHLIDQSKKMEVCSKLWSVWIITNEDLYQLINQDTDEGTEVRFFTLRSITFLVLLVVNFLSLFIIKWFKMRYPPKTNIANYSLIFKNLKDDSVQNLLSRLRKDLGQFQYRQAFIIKKIQPFYTKYQRKLECFYTCKIEENPKKFKKLIKELHFLDKFCSKHEQSFYNDGNRAILVFNDIVTRQKVHKRYCITKMKQFKMFFSTAYELQYGTYCESCPRPGQIIWNNIGIVEKQGFKVKVLSVIYFIIILTFLVFTLYFLLDILYRGHMDQPFHSIVQNVILLFLVVVALIFRNWMNKLSEMRFPNTFTRRTMFIVITTVLFHFIFYLFIPSIYLMLSQDMRGSILNLISNQAITFIVVQVILSGMDLMYCCWNRNRANVENPDRPIGCQKILHQKMQYPRFPIQFKLIILFKIWSFITFFAFHVPLVLFFICIALAFLYIKDKLNLYYHYRMEEIDNQVEFKFLKIYSNVFTVYLYQTFVFTQHNQYQYTIGAIVTLAFIVLQLMYFGTFNYKEEDEDGDSVVSATLSEIDERRFSTDYQRFLNIARNDLVDVQIKDYLSKQGYGTMQTEQTLTSQLISS